MFNKKTYFAVIVLAACYWKFSSIELPDNFEAPISYKFNKVVWDVVGFLSNTAEKLNLGLEPTIFRGIFARIASFKSDSRVKTVDTQINEVNVRVFTPVSITDISNAQIIIYYHGGGYFLLGSDFYHDYLTELSVGLNAVAISVDYRLAPEHPFPTPTDDCYSVTKHILQSSSDEYGNSDNVILAGDSAGGNVVAVMTQRLLAEKIKQPRLQVLIYPWTQMFNNRLPSHIRYEHSIFKVGTGAAWYMGFTDVSLLGDYISYNNHTVLITDQKLKKKLADYTSVDLIPEKYKMNRDYYKNYKREEVFPVPVDSSRLLLNKMNNELNRIFTSAVSPGLADPEQLVGLPDAYLIIVEMDPLKDEGLIYSERMRQAGVKVEVKFYENTYHGCAQMVRKEAGPPISYQVSKDMLADLISYIKKNVV